MYSSGLRMYSHSLYGGVPLPNNVWTHGDFLWFATFHSETTKIWQIGLAPDAPPVEVETFPNPEEVRVRETEDIQFLPASCRLAFVFRDEVIVWDARNSRIGLRWTEPSAGFVSSSFGGRLFACGTGSKIHLWTESPTGYIPHKIISRCPTYSGLLLSRESIATFDDRTIWLWPTKEFVTAPPGAPTQQPQSTDHFILDFSLSLDGALAVVAMKGCNVVTILKFKSGVPRLIIDTSIGVHGHKVIGNFVVVLGLQKVITWNILAGDCAPSSSVGLEERSPAIKSVNRLDVYEASISSDSRYILHTARVARRPTSLHIHSASTGKHLRAVSVPMEWVKAWFSPNGRDILCIGDNGEAGKVWRFDIEGGRLFPVDNWLADIGHVPEGYPWRPSRGYRVTSDWWILNSEGKRVLMLPPPWQADAVRRVWEGQFLALLHRGLSEPVILDLE